MADFSDIDLSNLTPGQGFKITGVWAGYTTGFSVSEAGDINGDGVDDVILGAPGGGRAHVVYGKVGGSANIELSGLSQSQGFTIRGAASGDRAGFSVSDAGDVNNDGHDDVIIGAPWANGRNGDAYVVFGKAGSSSTVFLSSLNAATGALIHGYAPKSELGYSVSSAGDVNNDGFDDMKIGRASCRERV